MKDLLVSCIAQAAFMVANLGSGILAARLLGPDGRGELAAVILWPALIANLGGLGITDAVVYNTANGKEQRSRIFASSVAVGLALSAVLILVGLVVVPPAYGGYRPEIRDIAYIYLLSIPLNYLGLYTSGMFQGGLKFGIWNVLRVLGGAAYVMFILLFFLAGATSVRSFVIASLAGSVLGLVVSLVLLKREGWIGWRIDLGLMKRFIQYGFPIHVAVILMIINQRLDQILISQWLQAGDLGIYVVALGIYGPLSGFVVLLAALAFPKISSQASPGGKALVFGRYMRLAVGVAAGGAILLAWLGPWLLEFLFGADFTAAAPVLRIFALAAVPFACKVIFIEGFKAYGKCGPIRRAELLAFVLNATFLLIVLNTYGPVGAAWAFVISQGCAAFYLGVETRQTLLLSLARVFRPTAADWAVLAAVLKVRSS